MAIKKISEFVSAIPSSDSKILFEQNGKGKSCTIGDVGKAIGINMDLLWENASPTSDFLEQEINLDFSNYKMIGIEFTYGENTSNLERNIIFNNINYGGKYCVYTVDGGNIFFVLREYRATTTGIKFNNAVYYIVRGGGSSEAQQHTKRGIPLKIYGVK